MKKSVEEMSHFELSRWITLMGAVNMISDVCEDKNIDFNSITLNPLDLQKYVEKTCDTLCMASEKHTEKIKNIQLNMAQKNTIKQEVLV